MSFTRPIDSFCDLPWLCSFKHVLISMIIVPRNRTASFLYIFNSFDKFRNYLSVRNSFTTGEEMLSVILYQWCLIYKAYINIHICIKPFFFLNQCKQSPDGRIEAKGQHGKSSLHIKDVKLSDSGRYDCEAASRIGGHQKSMYLDIECKFPYFVFSLKVVLKKQKYILNGRSVFPWCLSLHNLSMYFCS